MTRATIKPTPPTTPQHDTHKHQTSAHPDTPLTLQTTRSSPQYNLTNSHNIPQSRIRLASTRHLQPPTSNYEPDRPIIAPLHGLPASSLGVPGVRPIIDVCAARPQDPLAIVLERAHLLHFQRRSQCVATLALAGLSRYGASRLDSTVYSWCGIWKLHATWTKPWVLVTDTHGSTSAEYSLATVLTAPHPQPPILSDV